MTVSTKNGGAEPPLFCKLYGIAAWLIGRVQGFPKVTRFSLGGRIVENVLIILEDVTRAQFRKRKLDLLIACNERLDVLRVLLRLAHESKGLSFRQYEFVTAELHEAGRMLGGWIKHERR